MYWYLERPEDRPIEKLRKLYELKRRYVCNECGRDLTHAIGKHSGHRFLYCKVCMVRYEYYEVKSRFDLLEPKKMKEIAEVMLSWDKARGKNFYQPNEKEYWYFLQPHMIKGISGGNRCLGGDEKIYDPVYGGYRKISEIDTDFHVLSWDGTKLVVARAKRPFLKGYDYLYEISLSNGSTFVSTLGHQVLTHSGYISIGLLGKQEQSLISPRQTNSVFSQLIQSGDDQNYVGTGQDFQFDYLVYFRLYDVLLRLVSNIFPDIFPLQGDVPGHIFYEVFEHMDDFLHKLKHTHPYQLIFRLSNLGVFHRFLAQFFGILYYAFYRPFESILMGLSQYTPDNAIALQPISAFSHRLQSNALFAQQANQYAFPLNTPFGLVSIDNIRLISTQRKPFYDFHVPIYNNYYHAGIIHHNSGKTATTVMEMVMQLEGWHPLQKENLKRLSLESWDERVRAHCKKLLSEGKWIHDPPIDGRVVAVDYSNYVDKIIGPEYEKWLTHADVEEIAYDNERRRYIKWKNGSRVEFLTTEQSLKSHGGSARHVIQVDEEPPQDYWIENMMRIISVGGRMLIGATAIDGVTWTEKEIWEPGEKGHKDIYVMEMSTYDNPINTKEVIEKIKAQCRDQVEIDIRIYGKRRLRGGHVYPEYQEREPWVIRARRIPKDKGKLILAIDVHPSIPHAALWIWVDFDGQWHDLVNGQPNLYEVASIFEKGTIPEIARRIREVEKEYWVLNGRSHDICLLEPAAWNRSQTSENAKTVYEQFIENGIYPIKGSKELEAGILEVRELLRIEDGYDHPRLMTFTDPPYSDYLLYEKRSYHYPDPRQALKLGKSPSQKPVDKDDHQMENERRIVQYVRNIIYDIENLENTIPQMLYNGSVVDVDFGNIEEEETIF